MYNEINPIRLSSSILGSFANFIGTPPANQYYGVNGEYTEVLEATFEDLKTFWDITSTNLYMLGLHSVMTDKDLIIQGLNSTGYAAGEADREAQIEDAAERAFTTFNTEKFDNGEDALFSLNAFASSLFGNFLNELIFMGDGVMSAYQDIGLGDIAPQAILAHEYGHQIQFDNGYRTVFADAVENGRYTELMADAYASYYLTHVKGQGVDAKRVSEFTDVFFNIGDCSFDSSTHHGTYLQREKASQFGMKLAKANQRRGTILTSAQFFEMFNRVYNTLL